MRCVTRPPCAPSLTACPTFRFSSAIFKFREEWAVTVRGNTVYGHISGPAHRLDVGFSSIGDAAQRSLPHGIVGQSFSNNAPRVGKLDSYPKAGRFATSAMGEGAIGWRGGNVPGDPTV